MFVKLEKNEWSYFVAHILPSIAGGSDLVASVDGKTNDNYPVKVTVKISESQAEEIVDVISRRFTSIGLRDDYEPNQEGLFLELLLDKFNPAS